MSQQDFHNFDPYDMLIAINEQQRMIANNSLEIVKAHNGLQHQLELVTRRVNEQQQEILELRCDLERITNYHNIMSNSA
jgi:hypothetical protein